jgi:hypothetical protein
MPHPGGWGWRRLMNYFLFSRPAPKGGVVDFSIDFFIKYEYIEK